MAAADRCICCGEIIPEGRFICPTCENIDNLTKCTPKIIGDNRMTANNSQSNIKLHCFWCKHLILDGCNHWCDVQEIIEPCKDYIFNKERYNNVKKNEEKYKNSRIERNE